MLRDVGCLSAPVLDHHRRAYYLGAGGNGRAGLRDEADHSDAARHLLLGEIPVVGHQGEADIVPAPGQDEMADAALARAVLAVAGLLDPAGPQQRDVGPLGADPSEHRVVAATVAAAAEHRDADQSAMGSFRALELWERPRLEPRDAVLLLEEPLADAPPELVSLKPPSVLLSRQPVKMAPWEPQVEPSLVQRTVAEARSLAPLGAEQREHSGPLSAQQLSAEHL